MNCWRSFTFCLALYVSALAQDQVTPSDRVTTHVNIRAAPSDNAAEIGQLHVGRGLPLVSGVPRWYEVQLGGGQTGFVSKAWTTVSRALLPRQQDELRIHFLNIGAGSCTVVECPGPGAAPMIVDCGSTAATAVDMGAQQTRTYVRNVLSQHQAPPNVVLSHGDVDHYGHIANTLDDIAIASIWQGGDPSDYSSASFPAWIASHQNGAVSLHRNFPAHFHNNRQPISADLPCGTASTFMLTANTGTTKNSQSLVIMIEYEDFTAILTGDAEGTTEAQAMRNFPDLRATVIAASHHGASTSGSNSQAWADATAANVLISSAGDRPVLFHPRCAATNRFTSLAMTKAHDIRCGSSTRYTNLRTNRAHYVTEVNGTVIVTSKGRSPITVNCTRSAECGVKIAH